MDARSGMKGLGGSSNSSTRPVCVRVKSDQHALIASIARECGIPRSDFLRTAIKLLFAYLNGNPPTPSGEGSSDVCTALKDVMSRLNMTEQ